MKICIQRKEKKTSVSADSFLGINFFTGNHELLCGDIIGLLPGASGPPPLTPRLGGKVM
jgi:hypothetical protein